MTDVRRLPQTRPFDLSAAGRVLLATLSGVAGAIHLVMVPSHSGESVVEGVGFLLAGWFQIGIAILLVTRPSRALLRFTMAGNLAFIGAWAVSRTWGLPLGEHAWHAETVSSVDLTCVGIEAGLVVACGLLLARPGLARGWEPTQFALGAVVPIGVVALASGVLMSPSARNHAHASHGGHGEHAAASGHVHGEDGDDKGLALLQNGHQHGGGAVELDSKTQAALSAQLAQTADLIRRYPTVADAEAAGYRRAGPFAPGLGTHFVNYTGFLGDNPDALVGERETLRPLLIYDGLEHDSPIAGFMYMAPGDDEPRGFIGPNDHWHYHTNTCIVMKNGVIEAPLGADQDVTQEQCAQFGGQLIRFTGYMVHVWTVPGYESERGVFSEINPRLACPDGTYYMKPMTELGFSTSLCKNEP
jgi:hypothetical protein